MAGVSACGRKYASERWRNAPRRWCGDFARPIRNNLVRRESGHAVERRGLMSVRLLDADHPDSSIAQLVVADRSSTCEADGSSSSSALGVALHQAASVPYKGANPQRGSTCLSLVYQERHASSSLGQEGYPFS